METTYEWVAEPLDEYGDIIDPLFGSSLKEVKSFAENYEGAIATHYALVRNTGDDDDGLQERGYAYLQPDGMLEARFCNGYRVPKRFRKRYYE